MLTEIKKTPLEISDFSLEISENVACQDVQREYTQKLILRFQTGFLFPFSATVIQRWSQKAWITAESPLNHRVRHCSVPQEQRAACYLKAFTKYINKNVAYQDA